MPLVAPLLESWLRIVKVLGHGPQGVGAKHYNRIDLDLIRDYNETLDAALEEAFQGKKIKLHGTYVAPGSKPVSRQGVTRRPKARNDM